MATQDDEAFLKKYGGYKPAPVSVPVTSIKPIIGNETPEQIKSRKAKEEREAAGETREEERLRLSQEAADIARRGESRDIEEKKFNRIDKLRSEFLGDPQIKKFQEVKDSVNQIIGLSSEQTPMAGIASVFTFMKILDPGSTVREGEAASAQNAAGVPERIRNYYNQLVSGNGLSVSQRKEMADVARIVYNQRLSGYNNKANIYRGLLIEQGADPDLQGVTLAEPFEIAAPAEGQQKGVPALQVAEGDRFSTDEDIAIASTLQGLWAQGKSIDEVNAKAIELTGGNGLSPETVKALQEDEATRQIRFSPNRSGVRVNGEAPGRGAAAAAAAVRGFTSNLGEEALAQFSPEAAAKLQAAGEYGQQQFPITSMLAEIPSSLVSPIQKVTKFIPGGPLAREIVEGTIYGAGEARPDAGLGERALTAAIGGGTSGVIGSLGRRFLPGGEAPQGAMLPEDEMINVPTGGMEAPAGMAPGVQAPPAGMGAPAGMAPPTGAAPGMAAGEVADEALDVGRDEMIELARKAVSRTPGASKARAELAEIAKVDPEARAAAERLGLELPTDILGDNAQLQRVTGLTRSQIGSEAETAWRKTYDAASERAYEAMDELNAVTDISKLSADVFNRLDTANKGLETQADDLRKQVTAAIDDTGRVDASNIKAYLEDQIRRLGGGKEGLAGLSAEEKKLWAMVSKGNPTYKALDDKRAEIGRAMTKNAGPWVDSNERRIQEIYAKLADDQMGFIEASAGKEIADKQRAANTLFKQMYEGRAQMQEIFGRNLSKDLGPLINQAITQGGKGGLEAINKLLTNIPEDMRGTVLTSGLFQTATNAKGGFSFTNFTNTYNNLRKNSLVFNQFAKAIGPEGVNLLNDFNAISRRISDASANIIGTGASTQINLLNAESLLSKIVKGLGGAAVAGGATSMLGADLLTTVVPVIAGAAGPELAQRFAGKTNADKLHALMKSEKFRDLAVSAATGEGIDGNVGRVVGSKEFRDYAKLAGIDMKDARNWLISGITKAGTIGATELAGVTPMEAPGVEMPQ